MEEREREDRPAEKMNYTTASTAGGEESRRRNPIGRSWPPFNKRRVKGGRAGHGEITTHKREVR
jgi:hypothetical protein